MVSAGDRLRYKALFEQTDADKDGFVSGVEIKNIFLQTGLPQNILAHIWNLCDMKQEGKLNPEQFALAMYLVHQKQAGKDPPAQLTPDLVPPSMRPKGAEGGGAAGGRSVYNNPELEEMAREIQALLQEKMQLERDVQETDYNISARNSETHSLQTEFDTLNTTLTQLTNQKNIAQKRLDDLDGQVRLAMLPCTNVLFLNRTIITLKLELIFPHISNIPHQSRHESMVYGDKILPFMHINL